MTSLLYFIILGLLACVPDMIDSLVSEVRGFNKSFSCV